jgi:hypothetical protein
MTELQEAIVDRLMVADKIGVRWATGPLGLAVEALQLRGMIPARSDATRTLGYPLLLCRALHTASSTLRTADDRGKLAITFFSETPPRPGGLRLSPAQQVATVLWSARRVHPSLCREGCPFAVRLGNRVNRYLAEGRLPPVRSRPPSCPALQARARSDGVASLRRSAEWSALKAFKAAESAAGTAQLGAWPGEHSARGAAHAARVAALANGVTGAIDFCVGLAREVGLKP